MDVNLVVSLGNSCILCTYQKHSEVQLFTVRIFWIKMFHYEADITKITQND